MASKVDKLDYFAGQAIGALVPLMSERGIYDTTLRVNTEELALLAYAIAEAMLKVWTDRYGD